MDQALLVGAEFIFGLSVSDCVGRGRTILDGRNWEDDPRYCVACEPSRRQPGLVFRVWQGSSRNMSILAWVLNCPVDTPTSSYWPTQSRLFMLVFTLNIVLNLFGRIFRHRKIDSLCKQEELYDHTQECIV